MKSLDPSCLDSKIIPVPNQTADIFNNYVFYDTPDNILNQIIGSISFQDKDGIINYNTRGLQSRRFNLSKSSNDAKNSNILQNLINSSQSERLWSRIISLPFTLKDFEGIHFLDSKRTQIRIEKEVSATIIASHIYSLVLQRKRRKFKSEFHIDELFDHIFSSIKGLVVIGVEDKKAIKKKLSLFLLLVCEICDRHKLTFISKSESIDNKFIINIRNTDNFTSRMKKIQILIDKEISRQRLQTRLPC